jgi:hypothetical protein
MSWQPAPPRGPAPWFKTIRDLFSAPDAVTRHGVGLTITEAVAELAEAVRELAAQIEKANRWNRPPDDDP